MHALGLRHEMARNDRSKFVWINYDNINTVRKYKLYHFIINKNSDQSF